MTRRHDGTPPNLNHNPRFGEGVAYGAFFDGGIDEKPAEIDPNDFIEDPSPNIDKLMMRRVTADGSTADELRKHVSINDIEAAKQRILEQMERDSAEMHYPEDWIMRNLYNDGDIEEMAVTGAAVARYGDRIIGGINRKNHKQEYDDSFGQ